MEGRREEMRNGRRGGERDKCRETGHGLGVGR